MFLNLAFCTLPCFDAVLERVKNGQKFLDMGCAFGQELRQLVRLHFPSGLHNPPGALINCP